METLIIRSEIEGKEIRYYLKVTPEEKQEFNKVVMENPEMKHTKAFKQARENLK